MGKQSWPAHGRQRKGKIGVELKGMGVSLHGKHTRGGLRKQFFRRSALPTPTRPPTQPGVDTGASLGTYQSWALAGSNEPFFKPVLDILLSSGLCQKGFVLLQVAIKHTKPRRAFFGVLLAVGKSHFSALQEPPVAPGNAEQGMPD